MIGAFFRIFIGGVKSGAGIIKSAKFAYSVAYIVANTEKYSKIIEKFERLLK